MSSPHRLLILVGLVMMVVTFVIGIRWWSAQRALDLGLGRLSARSVALARYEASGMAMSTAMTGTDDLVSQVQRTLTAAGISNTAFRGVQPLGERQGDGGGAREQTVQINLQTMRPADLGAWLAAWCVPTQPWRVTAITWTHPTDTSFGTGVEDSPAGQVTITVSSQAAFP